MCTFICISLSCNHLQDDEEEDNDPNFEGCPDAESIASRQEDEELFVFKSLSLDAG